MVQRVGFHRLPQRSNRYTGMAIYYNMASMPRKGIAGGEGATAARQEALADIRCRQVRGQVAIRKGQSTGDRITSQRMRGCDKRQWSKNITTNHRWEIRRRVVVAEPQVDGRQCNN